jgi:hypothetical protein
MFFVPENDISQWKEDLKNYDVRRKTVTWKDFQPIKPTTFKEVKQKELEYNPILAKYADEQRVIFGILNSDAIGCGRKDARH